MRALGRAIGFCVPMCSSRVLLGLESIARARLRNHRSCANVCDSSPVGGCKYERDVRYVSTDEQFLLKKQKYKYLLIHIKICMYSNIPPIVVVGDTI